MLETFGQRFSLDQGLGPKLCLFDDRSIFFSLFFFSICWLAKPSKKHLAGKIGENYKKLKNSISVFSVRTTIEQAVISNYFSDEKPHYLRFFVLTKDPKTPKKELLCFSHPKPISSGVFEFEATSQSFALPLFSTEQPVLIEIWSKKTFSKSFVLGLEIDINLIASAFLGAQKSLLYLRLPFTPNERLSPSKTQTRQFPRSDLPKVHLKISMKKLDRSGNVI